MLINIYIAYLAFVMICLGMDKHYKSVLSTNINIQLKKSFKIAGWILLAVSLYLFILFNGISLGITYWIGITAPVITLIALILNYKAKILLLLSVVFFIILLLLSFI